MLVSFCYCLQAWNPCFDVTPAALIEAIITDKGLISKRDKAFDVPAFLKQKVRSHGNVAKVPV